MFTSGTVRLKFQGCTIYRVRERERERAGRWM